MELMAAIEGMAFAIDNNIKNVELYSDSAYVINALNKGWLMSWVESHWKKKDGSLVKNADLWRKFASMLGSFDDIQFIKVKGHNGNMFNEIADRYAKEEIKKLNM